MAYDSRARTSRVLAVARNAAAEPPPTGQRFPLGATVLPGGVNFSVFSRQALVKVREQYPL